MSDLDLDPFRDFLHRLDYAAQTSDHTVLRAKRLETLEPQVLPNHWRSYLLRIIAGGEAGVLPDELTGKAKACLELLNRQRLAHGLRGGRSKAKRKRPAVSVPDTQWAKLLRALSDPKRPHPGPRAALLVEASTALRIGDVLRIPRRTVLEGVKNGVLELTQKGGGTRTLYVEGAPEAWGALATVCAASKGQNVAECVSVSADVTSSGAAYKACERVLKELQPELGIDRLFSHRLRRTVAVQTARVTRDVTVVAETLGHAPGSKATFVYLDEARPERVAGVARQVRAKFGGGG